ncbi:flagellar hook-basal body protein FliE [Carboxydothermus islandicus]|uniref:Flagellar hook-basal body complex protein FliE n=1 Tax=Carboxydothermus islandicus TaxID=661089 RepID=A0A1L8D4M9_9THEO|nr:flagellar hook-basal body complex protein FliE [Carboxydothermus islandicus]GAV26156.1 flagellar hook-basal body protein FliE [Carboxydothermus islandicus]
MEITGISFPNTILSNNSTQTTKTLDFEKKLAEALDKVNEKQLKAEQATQDFLAGKVDDIHQVLILAQEAKLSLQLAVEVRNKIVEAYQEISRMQI